MFMISRNVAAFSELVALNDVLVQVAWADAVMLAEDHAAQAKEVAFHLVGVLAVVAVDEAVVHTLDGPARVQQVLVQGFVRADGSRARDVAHGKLSALGFALADHRPSRSRKATTTRRVPL